MERKELGFIKNLVTPRQDQQVQVYEEPVVKGKGHTSRSHLPHRASESLMLRLQVAKCPILSLAERRIIIYT